MWSMRILLCRPTVCGCVQLMWEDFTLNVRLLYAWGILQEINILTPWDWKTLKSPSEHKIRKKENTAYCESQSLGHHYQCNSVSAIKIFNFTRTRLDFVYPIFRANTKTINNRWNSVLFGLTTDKQSSPQWTKFWP